MGSTTENAVAQQSQYQQQRRIIDLRRTPPARLAIILRDSINDWLAAQLAARQPQYQELAAGAQVEVVRKLMHREATAGWRALQASVCKPNRLFGSVCLGLFPPLSRSLLEGLKESL